MPPRQVTLTETEWQHIYELIKADTTGWNCCLDTQPRNFMAETMIELNDGILKKFDAAPDIPFLPPDFLDRVREKALDPNFPTPNCLKPGAIAYYLEYGDFLDSDEEHVKTCIHCRAMLDNLGKRYKPECPKSPDGKHHNTNGVGTFGVYQCRHCHHEMTE